MSKGSPIVSLRLERELLAQIDATILRMRSTRFAGQQTRTDYIVAAVREKIAHSVRASGSRRRRSKQIKMDTIGMPINHVDQVQQPLRDRQE